MLGQRPRCPGSPGGTFVAGEPRAAEAFAKQLEARSWMFHRVTKRKGGPAITKYSKYFLVQLLQVKA